jgi:hypothetical protein
MGEITLHSPVNAITNQNPRARAVVGAPARATRIRASSFFTRLRRARGTHARGGPHTRLIAVSGVDGMMDLRAPAVGKLAYHPTSYTVRNGLTGGV